MSGSTPEERLDQIEQRVDRLTSVNEIRQLVYQYAWAINSKDEAMIESLFAEPGAEGEGHYANAARIIASLNTVGMTAFLVGNHLIDFDDADHARGKVYCWAQYDLGERFLDQTLYYDDRYVRRDGRWIFETARVAWIWYGQVRAEHPLANPGLSERPYVIGVGPAYDEIRKSGRG